MIDLFAYNAVCITATVIVICVITYKFFFSSHNYWDSQDVPSFKVTWRKILSTYSKPLHHQEWELYNKLGRVHGRYDGQIPVLTVGDPDILKDILVKDFHVFQNRRDCKFGDPITDNNVSLLTGEDWKRVRNVLTPTFTSGKLKLMRPKLDMCAERVVDQLVKGKGAPIDLERLFSGFSMDVIASCAFGTKINSLETPDNPFVVHAKSIFQTGIRSVLPVVFPVLMKIFHISMLNPTAIKFFRDFTKQIIDERSKCEKPSIDFLQLLLDARKNQEIVATDDGENKGKSKTKFLTDDELSAQCVLFFMAGYDTATSLLQVVFYYLALHQEIQDKVYEEMQMTLASKEEIENEDIVSMKYMDCVTSEAMRIGSSCIRMDRRAERDYNIESRNILVKKGQLISLPMYCIHHDPEWYPEPEKFDPRRFSPESKATRHPFTYMPFGIGPRSCVGNRFALIEVKLCLIKILQKFKIKTCSETKIPITFREKQGQLVPDKVFVSVEPRD